jgi:fermentation-respiration switch protein FrsA (DUF1100 family)
MNWRRLALGRFTRKRLMTDLWLLPLVTYAVLVVYAWLLADRHIFLPQPSSYGPADDLIRLATPDGATLCAAYLPNPAARFTLLYNHGNAEDLGDVLPELRELRDLGFAVFAYDYRGYGLSSGSPSTKGACVDATAAYRYLTGTLGVPPERVVPYGRSVGGGPAVHLAASERVGGLILQSAFTSAFVVMTRVPLLPFDRFRNLALMARVRCPVLVMHGRRDGVIPFSHGPRLYARAPEPKRYLWLDDVGHNSFPAGHEAEYRAALVEFESLLATTHGLAQASVQAESGGGTPSAGGRK